MTSEPITWKRLFVGSGFNVSQEGNSFNFSAETEENRDFLVKILGRLGQQKYYMANLFSPTDAAYEQALWLSAVEICRGPGCEGGTPGFNNIRLVEMDTYMAGLIRWLSYIGVKTWGSCEGQHSDCEHYIQADSGAHSKRINKIIREASFGKYMFRNGKIILSSTLQIIKDKNDLLNMAEYIYNNKDRLKMEEGHESQ